MAKVDRNTIQTALNEANELEYELSFDEQCRDLDEFEGIDDWKSELEPESDYIDIYDDYDLRNDDYFNGDYYD